MNLKAISIGVFIFCGYISASAQSTWYGRIGANLSTIAMEFNTQTPKDIFDFGYHPGINLGLISSIYSIGAYGSIDLEIQYSKKGSSVSSKSNNETLFLNFHYLSLPITYEVMFKRLRIEVGAEPSLFLLGKANSENISNIDITNDIKSKFDLGVIGGLNFPISSDVGLGLRYVHGLNYKYQFYTGTNPDGSGNLDFERAANRSIQLSLVVSLNDKFKSPPAE